MRLLHVLLKQSYNMSSGGLTRFTLELSFAISQASTAHQVIILCAAVPLLSNAVVVATVMAPL